MSLYNNLEKIKKSLSTGRGSLRQFSLADATVYYRKILKKIPDISHLKNIVLFGGVASVFILILFSQRFQAVNSYIPREPLPGGTYIEGVVGKIEQLNPIYSAINPAEQAVTSILFSGLTKKDGSRKMIPDLAQKWEISSDGLTYTFILRKNLKWSDGAPITSDDVLYTVSAIQDPDTRSPLMEAWRDVVVTKKDDQTVIMTLKTAYSPFISNTDLPILPKHILVDVPSRNLKIAEFSLKPVGSGPFVFSSLKKIRENEEVSLLVNDNYWGKKPYLTEVIIKTYADEKKLLAAYSKKEVIGIEKISGSETKKNNLPNINLIQLLVPQYDVIYFNLREGLSKEKLFREAVSLAINRNQLVTKTYSNQAFPIYTPVLPGYSGYNPRLKSEANVELAKQKMIQSGYTLGADGIFVKNGVRASVKMVLDDGSDHDVQSKAITEMLKKAGIEVKREKYPIGALFQDHIRPRKFDLLLISQNLGYDSDLYAFWHATQVSDPGLNFSGFSDRRLDKAIEQARQSSDPILRKEKYQIAQKIIWDETPAVFLVWPNYIYGVSKKLKGIENQRLIDPANRFWNISDWYIYDKPIYKTI